MPKNSHTFLGNPHKIIQFLCHRRLYAKLPTENDENVWEISEQIIEISWEKMGIERKILKIASKSDIKLKKTFFK